MEYKEKMHRREEVRKERKVENYGADRVKGLGTVNPGIASYNYEPTAEGMAKPGPWSKMTDVSMESAMRMVGGKGTSYQMNEKE